MRTPTKMVDVLSRAYEFLKLEDDRRMSGGDRPKEMFDQCRDIGRNMSVVEVSEHQNCSGGRTSLKSANSHEQTFRPKVCLRKNQSVWSFQAYRIIVSLSYLVEHLRGRRDMRWPNKMFDDPHDRDNTKYCTFHNDYDHLTEDCRHWMWEVINNIANIRITPGNKVDIACAILVIKPKWISF